MIVLSSAWLAVYTTSHNPLASPAAPASISVHAGNDNTICYGSSLLINDLGASISGDVYDGDWITFGNGRFQPGDLLTVRYSEAQSQNITYVPGSNDLALGYFRLMLISDSPLGGTPQEKVSDEVKISFQTAPPLSCNSNFNISLDENCTQVVDVSLLQYNPVPPFTNYIVTLYNTDGSVIPDNILTGEHIGKTINFKVGHLCTANFCTGSFSVRDNYPPVFECKNDTILCSSPVLPEELGFPIPVGAWIDTLINGKYIVKDWDRCSDVQLEYTDSVVFSECMNNHDRVITRKWKATDAHNNASQCTQTIVVERTSLSDVIFPVNFDGSEAAFFECGSDYPLLASGLPSPDSTGIPGFGQCSDFEYFYSDVVFAGCGSSVRMIRSWSVIDWCTTNDVSKNQIIEIRDSKAPEIQVVDTLRWNTDPYDCFVRKERIPNPILVTDCSDYNINWSITDTFGNDVSQYISIEDNNGYLKELPFGVYLLKYFAADACNNSSEAISVVVVSDKSLPNPVCKGHVKVALDEYGNGRIYATSFDNGSTDNCGIEKFEARRMTSGCDIYNEWRNYVDFCCSDIGDTIKVQLKITDIHGNINICISEVLTEDKIKPALTCPPDITLECSDFYDPDNLDVFGRVVTDESLVEPIVVSNYYHQGIVGYDGVAHDNCSVTVSSSARFDVDCSVGHIYRKFIATDGSGRKDSCIQTITILNPHPFTAQDIVIPPTYDGEGCRMTEALPDITGKPSYTNILCGQVSESYTDQSFFMADSACVKILREWTVIDWCQFNQVTGEGVFGPYIQVIKLNSTVKPEIISSCADTTFCMYDINCSQGLVTMEATAVSDCTPAEQLSWSYVIDIYNDGIGDLYGTTRAINIELPPGRHSIKWVVTDQCGNYADCKRYFEVVDCKNPTPYCLESTTISLDQVTGSALIWAVDYDHGSYDNCTDTESLIFTFNGAYPVDSLISIQHYFKENGQTATDSEYYYGLAQLWLPDSRSSGMYFDCSDIPDGRSATLYLDMTVFDEARNSDYCTVEIILQDNADFCPDVITDVRIGGKITTYNELVPEGTTVFYESGEIFGQADIDSEGVYSIPNLESNRSYRILAHKESDPLQGVDAIDLVHIQRHILGIKRFDSPYQILASDVNGSGSVSVADLSAIRKVILGINDDFPNDVPSWIFVSNDGITDPLYPYNYKSYYDTDFLTRDTLSLDFTAIKMGDVNFTAIQLKDEEIETRNNSRSYPISILKSSNQSGEKWTFIAEKDIKADAFFFNFGHTLSNISPVILLKDHAQSFESDYGVGKNSLKLIMHQYEPVNLYQGDTLFEINFDENNLELLENLLSNEIQSFIYVDEKPQPIKFEMQQSSSKDRSINILENPVSDHLTLIIIGINERINYDIFNSSGITIKSGVIYPYEDLFEYNIDLDKDSKPGIYFIKLRFEDKAETLKFIKID